MLDLTNAEQKAFTVPDMLGRREVLMTESWELYLTGAEPPQERCPALRQG